MKRETMFSGGNREFTDLLSEKYLEKLNFHELCAYLGCLNEAEETTKKDGDKRATNGLVEKQRQKVVGMIRDMLNNNPFIGPLELARDFIEIDGLGTDMSGINGMGTNMGNLGGFVPGMSNTNGLKTDMSNLYGIRIDMSNLEGLGMNMGNPVGMEANERGLGKVKDVVMSAGPNAGRVMAVLAKYYETYKEAIKDFEKGMVEKIGNLLKPAVEAIARGAKNGANIALIIRTVAPTLAAAAVKFLTNAGMFSPLTDIADSTKIIGMVIGAVTCLIATAISEANKEQGKNGENPRETKIKSEDFELGCF